MHDRSLRVDCHCCTSMTSFITAGSGGAAAGYSMIATPETPRRPAETSEATGGDQA
jgi:hypothetical protein